MNASTIQPLIQRALDLMETASSWERKAAKKAHMCGLQGEKRRLRYLSRKARNIVDWYEHKTYDIIKIKDATGRKRGLDISAQEGFTDVNNLVDIRTTVEGIIDKLWIIYDEAHQIANELFNAKCNKFSKKLLKYANELFCILGHLQRAQDEYEMADYEYHHISRYQIGWCNIHDKYKKKEKKQGYRS